MAQMIFQNNLHVSHCIRKPTIYICENKRRRSVTAKLISAFVFATWIVQSPSSFIQNFQPLTIFCNCTARFVSDLAGNPNCWFSHAQAHVCLHSSSLPEKNHLDPLYSCSYIVLTVSAPRLSYRCWLSCSYKMSCHMGKPAMCICKKQRRRSASQ